MGTNFYLHTREDCDCCGQSVEKKLHIGKSSAGWVFLLKHHEGKAETLDEWIDLLYNTYDYEIRDEYGKLWSRCEMVKRILSRCWVLAEPVRPFEDKYTGYDKKTGLRHPKWSEWRSGDTYAIIKGEFS